MSRIDGPESDGAGSDEQALIGKGKRPLQHPCWGWSRYAFCSGDPPTSNLVDSIIKSVDFRQKSSSSRRAAPLLQGTSNAGGASEAPDSLSASLQNKALLYVTSHSSRRKAAATNAISYNDAAMIVTENIGMIGQTPNSVAVMIEAANARSAE